MNENPIARALDEAGDGPEARGYTVPSGLVRRRIARLRAWRAGGVAALVVALVGGGAAAGSAGWLGTRHGEPIGGDQAAVGDWPAQFSQCGLPAAAVEPAPLSSARLVVADATSAMPAGGRWGATVTADVPVAGDGQGWVWGTDLLAIRDGVVVGVHEGAQTPPVDGLDEWLGGAAPDFALESFPLVTQVSLPLASCDQYPSGQGDPDLAPGTYELVVAQTISYVPAAGGERVDLRLGATTTVTVTAGAGPDSGATAADAAACGAPEAGLAALTSPEANPYAFRIDAEITGEAFVGLPLPIAFSVPAQSAKALDEGLALSRVRAVLTSGGVVVGDAPRLVDPAAGATDGSTLNVGVAEDCRARDAAASEPESGPAGTETGTDLPLAAGDYDVWLVIDARPLSGDEGSHVQVVAGPWSMSLVTHPGSTPTVAGDGDLAACGTTIDALAARADAGNPTFRVDATLPARWPLDERADDLELTLANVGPDHVEVSTSSPAILLTREGTVVGGTVLGGTTTGGLDPGSSWSARVAEYPLSCQGAPGGAAVRDLTGDPLRGGNPDLAGGPIAAGEYDLWVWWGYEVGGPSESSHEGDAVVAGPWQVRLG